MTVTPLQAAGYVVFDETAIWGYGETAAAAWADMLAGMKEAGVRVIDEPTEGDIDSPGRWARASGFKTSPATAALLQQVEEHGGNIAWGAVGRIICMRDEEDPGAGDG